MSSDKMKSQGPRKGPVLCFCVGLGTRLNPLYGGSCENRLCFYEAITDNINLAGPGGMIWDQFLQISQNGITRDTFYIHKRGISLVSAPPMSPNHCHSSVTR